MITSLGKGMPQLSTAIRKSTASTPWFSTKVVTVLPIGGHCELCGSA